MALVVALALLPAGASRASGAGTGAGEGEPVPERLALLVMLKVLTYDKNLADRGGGDFVVLVAVEPGQAAQRRSAQVATEELDGATLRSRPVKFVYGSLGDGAALRKQLDASKAQAILLLRGVSNAGVATVTETATETQVYTLALDPQLVEKSIALGVTNEDGRPKILVNLTAARNLNASFEPSVLKLARLIP